MSEEIKTIPLRHATNEDYTKIIADLSTANVSKEMEIIRLNNIIVKLKKVLWKRCEEARKNEQYVRLNCYKDILNELVNTIYEVDGETNKEW